ncbi:hypothetical protein ACFSQ7_43965 [Paenibacillus rhizoplanae]
MEKSNSRISNITKFFLFLNSQSGHKKTPTVRVTDKKMEMTWWGADSIQKQHQKKLHEFYMVASETLYPDGNVAHSESNQNYFNYELYKKNW